MATATESPDEQERSDVRWACLTVARILMGLTFVNFDSLAIALAHPSTSGL
jgi:hypothetical protein